MRSIVAWARTPWRRLLLALVAIAALLALGVGAAAAIERQGYYHFTPPEVVGWTPTPDGLSHPTTSYPEGATTRPLPRQQGRETLTPALPGTTGEGWVDVPVTSTFTVSFNRQMSRGMVERAIRLTPSTPGTFAWQSDRIVTFTPSQPLRQGTDYRLEVGRGARSVLLWSIRQPFAVTFSTAGDLKVTSVYPARGSTELGVYSTIDVSFNRPVVPLAALSETPGLNPLLIQPPTDGLGRWIGSSNFTFTPTSLKPATVYTVTVPRGLTDAQGGVLAQAEVFTFTTVFPAIAAHQPGSFAHYVDPATDIRVTFNQPMDKAAVEEHFAVTDPQGFTVTGTLQWESETTLVFTPRARLAAGATYQVRVGAGAQNAARSAATRQEESWGFTVIEAPKLVASSPRDGDMAARVEGRLVLNFNVPMDRDSVVKNLSIVPKLPQIYGQNWQSQDTSLQFYALFDPSETYTVTLGTATVDKLGRPLEGQRTIVFRSALLPPSVSLVNAGWVPGGKISVYNAYTSTRQFSNVRNVSRLDFRLTTLDPVVFFQAQRDYQFWQNYRPTAAPLATWSTDVKVALNKTGLISVTVTISRGEAFANVSCVSPSPPSECLAPTGLYFLEVTTPEGVGDRQIILITRTNLALKFTERQALVWATDLQSGQPVAGRTIRLLRSDGTTAATGRTNSDGVFLTDLPADTRPPEQKGYGPSELLAVTEGDGELAMVSSYWNSGISTWDFNLPGQYSLPGHVVYVYTDRPIYRPAQTVYFKGIVRADDDAVYRLAAAESVTVTVRDGQGKEVYAQKLPLSSFGTFNGELVLGQEASLGSYRIDALLPGQTLDPRLGPVTDQGVSFTVAAYRKPEYLVTVAADRPGVIQGDTIAVTVTSSFYFGAPVAGAQVNWRVYADPYYFSIPDQWYSFADYDDEWLWYAGSRPGEGRRALTQGQGTTDAQGRLSFTVPADLSPGPSPDRGGVRGEVSQIFTIEATVREANNQEVSERTQVIVHKGEFYLGVRPTRYAAEAGKEATVEIVAVPAMGSTGTAGGTGTAGVTGVPGVTGVKGVTCTVEIYSRKWNNVQVKEPSGYTYWKSVAEDTLLSTQVISPQSSVLSPQPSAQDLGPGTWDFGLVKFTPQQSGTYRIVVKGRDNRGNDIRSAAYLWVYRPAAGYVPWRLENNDRIQLVADKREYKPGETAKILVTAPFADSVALVTVERGKVRSYRLVQIAGNSALLDVPLEGDYAPNVFVSVNLFKGVTADHPTSEFKLGYVELTVNDASKSLALSIATDKARYQPGETVTYRLRTSDSRGRGVPAEVSLSLVDAAVLALADDNAKPIGNAFYARRGLAVQNAQTWLLSMERLNRTLDQRAKGGGGAEAGPSVRREFLDTAYWQADLVTDKDGNGQVTIKLPDNLTTWRMLAKGVTLDTKVGDAKQEVIATQDILVRPVLPRFLTVGDVASVGAIVHNYTESPQKLTISAQVNGAQFGSVAGTTALTTTATISPGGQQKFTWSLTVPKTRSVQLTFAAIPTSPLTPPLPGEGKVTVTPPLAGEGQGERLTGDAVQMTLPVQALAIAQTVATGGEVPPGSTVTETVKLPIDADDEAPSYLASRNGGYDGASEVVVTAEPSLAGGLQEGLAYLAGYPYGCVEQILSTFLPDVLISLAGKDLGLLDQKFQQEELPKMVQPALQKLYHYQHANGAWGWWENDPDNASTTSYVLYGLLQARRAGYAVDQSVVDRGLTWLRSWLDSTTIDMPPQDNGAKLNTAGVRAFALYVLAEHGRGDLGMSVSLYDQRDKLSLYGKAYLAQTLWLLNGKKADSRVQTMLNELVSAARSSATTASWEGAHWEEEAHDWWAMNTDVRSTAVVLDTLVRIDPQNPLIPKSVRWLMAMRQNGRWGSTYETTWSLIALTDYLCISEELQADYTYAVAANGQPIGGGKVDKSNLHQPNKLRLEAKDLLTGEANRIAISRWAAVGQTDKGKLYYTIALRYFASGPAIQPASQGLSLSRQYLPFNRPDAGPVHGIASGEVVRVKVTVTATQTLHYLVVEDPLPAGLEAVDTSLKTTSVGLPGAQVKDISQRPWWYYNYWGWAHIELRDEKVAFFATTLPPGSYEYTYLARATTPGVFQVLPPQGYEMYFPEVFGNGAGEVFTVVE